MQFWLFNVLGAIFFAIFRMETYRLDLDESVSENYWYVDGFFFYRES
jgi:hypothetical protein